MRRSPARDTAPAQQQVEESFSKYHLQKVTQDVFREENGDRSGEGVNAEAKTERDRRL